MPHVTSVVQTSETSVRVTVIDGYGPTIHDVTSAAADIARHAPGINAGRPLTASSEFMLQREPNESIVRRFDFPFIEYYFPGYPVTIRRTVAQG